MMDTKTSDIFTDRYFKSAEVIKNKGLSFTDILDTKLFSRDSAHVLDIPIGLGDEDAVISLRLGEGTSHHGLIGGGTGGGKSTLLHTIIMSSMLHYSPDQLHLYMMDFKGGTEFKIYESERLPHIQLLALDAMQEFGESILQNLIEEMENRSNAFKNAGGYTKIEDYVRGTGNPMPRILVIMDEFQILFDDSTNRKVAMRSANHAKRIVTEGRAYGVHLLNDLPVHIHMGNTIKVADPFEIIVDRKRKHNLLVCGSNERMANNIVNEYMVSAAINTSTSIYCIDGDSLVGDDVSGDFYNVLQSHCSNFYLATSRTDIVQFIHDIYEIYSARKKSNESGIIFIIIKNLQFLDIIKSMLKGETVEESEYIETEDDSTPAVDNSDPFASLNNFISSRSNSSNNLSNSNEKLLKLIEDGSGFGIHFVISSLEYQTVKDCMHYGENSLAKFPERIIFSLNDNDADNLVENVSVTGLRDNTVYFTDGVKDTYQMKPYIAPTAMELEHFLSSLN